MLFLLAEIRKFGPIWLSWIECVLYLKIPSICAVQYSQYKIVHYSTVVQYWKYYLPIYLLEVLIISTPGSRLSKPGGVSVQESPSRVSQPSLYGPSPAALTA